MRSRALSCLLPCLVVLTGCGNREQAKDLLAEIRGDDYRNSYQRAPGWLEPHLPAQGGPHGSFIDIYVNDVLAEAINQAADSGESLSEWPEGSLIVKDGFSDAQGDNLRFVTLMEKRGGSDWFWAEFDDKLKVDFAGVNKSTCTNCHSAGDDSVLAFDLP